MKLEYQPYLLEYKHRFGVSSNSRTHTQTVITKISWEGFEGYGEACLPPYLGETLQGTIELLEKAKPILAKVTYPCSIIEIINTIDELSKNSNAAKAAIDIALHDLRGKIEGKSIAELYRLNESKSIATSCTIGIDTEEKIKQKIEEAAEFKILKIKAGTPDDKALINLIRKYTDKKLYVDVNQGWNDKHFAVDMIAWFKEQGVLLIEQPLPVNKIDDMAWVTQHSELPTIADECAKRLIDLATIKDVFSGVNIKLMKCTGIKEAFEMIELCKQFNLKIFLGCMAESSCATAAMAQLMSCADYIDLDAPHLLKNDPFEGLNYNDGNLLLDDVPGIGVTPKTELIYI